VLAYCDLFIVSLSVDDRSLRISGVKVVRVLALFRNQLLLTVVFSLLKYNASPASSGFISGSSNAIHHHAVGKVDLNNRCMHS